MLLLHWAASGPCHMLLLLQWLTFCSIPPVKSCPYSSISVKWQLSPVVWCRLSLLCAIRTLVNNVWSVFWARFTRSWVWEVLMKMIYWRIAQKRDLWGIEGSGTGQGKKQRQKTLGFMNSHKQRLEWRLPGTGGWVGETGDVGQSRNFQL